MSSSETLTLALPKGRLLKALAPRLAALGIRPEVLSETDRRLVRDAGTDFPLRLLFLKPEDVPTYVEHGAAEVGVVGRDVLLERGHELYVPAELGIGRCRMVVAAPREKTHNTGKIPRVATKYPKIAAAHFATRGETVELIAVGGSVELAPLVGLSDLIVDLVETGITLEQNGLEIRETVCEVSAVAVVHRARMKLRREGIERLLRALSEEHQALRA